jgi:hypothetical protein
VGRLDGIVGLGLLYQLQPEPEDLWHHEARCGGTPTDYSGRVWMRLPISLLLFVIQGRDVEQQRECTAKGGDTGSDKRPSISSSLMYYLSATKVHAIGQCYTLHWYCKEDADADFRSICLSDDYIYTTWRSLSGPVCQLAAARNWKPMDPSALKVNRPSVRALLTRNIPRVEWT